MLDTPLVGVGSRVVAAGADAGTTVTHARFLALVIGVVVVFLVGLALLTVARMLRRRAALRAEQDSRSRTESAIPVSPWVAAGQRAKPIDASGAPPASKSGSAPSQRDSDEEDDDDDELFDSDADDSGAWDPDADDGFDPDDDDLEDTDPRPPRF